MIPRKPFIYFLLDTSTGKAYYRNAGGTIKTLVIAAGSVDVTLKHAPGNWMDTLLEFERNATYEGINRAYSTPMELVKEVQVMVTELFLLGYGTEAALTLAVFQYNSRPQTGEPQYLLYFKGPLDLSNLNNKVLEGATVNIMEGGVAQLLKNYESTPLEIPCDGSIAENQKINFDGLLVEDVLYYQFVPFTNDGGARSILPSIFVSDEGDNFGIVHNDPSFENILTAPDALRFFQDSPNYNFYSSNKIKVRVQGSIIVKSSTGSGIGFSMYIQTSAHPTASPLAALVNPTGLSVTGNIKYSFDVTVSLVEFEKLYFSFFGGDADNHLTVVSGDVSLSFASYSRATRAWGITLYDAIRLAWKQINVLASTNGLNYNYNFTSQYLLNKLNLFVTSGDALRASGDSSYQRFFSNIQTGQTIHQTFGPVIKTTLKELFEAAKIILCGVMGTGHNGTGETLYFEKYGDIFNSSIVDFSIGEIANLEWGWNKDKGFSDLDLGYKPQTYDQKAGKYEYNTTLSMKAPINSFTSKLDLTTGIRTDSYGIEKLRSNVGNATSTTKNDSDNSVFIVNVDNSASIFDFFKADFVSLITDPDNSLNTNIHLLETIPAQPLQLPVTDGEYFQPQNDTSIIVFSVLGYSATEACNLTINGIVNSNNKPPLAPPDSCTIKLWHNGIVLFQQTIVVASINQPITINHNFSQLLQFKDCIYISLETTATAEATLNTAALTIGTLVSMTAADIPIDAGTFRKLLSWFTFIPVSTPYAVGSSVIQYGYQYFLFNSLVPNSIFDLSAQVKGFIEGSTDNCVIEVYINGVLQAETIIIPGSVSRIPFIANLLPVITRTYALGDVVFVAAYPGNSTVQFINGEIDLTSNYIKAYNLKRVQYDSLTGIPNIATDNRPLSPTFGKIRSDIAGAPYNIEELTPGYLRDVIWADYFKSCFVDKVRGDLTFQTLSKNPYLSRTVAGVTITENDNKNILNANRIFYPISGSLKSNVPIRFAELMGRVINAHIHATFMGTDFYFFVNKAGQKPALNESQEWTFVLSPKTNLVNFLNITSFNIPDMADNSLNYSKSCPVQLVPYNQPVLSQYHTRSREQFLFADQVSRWINQDNYGQLRQIGDTIYLQHISNGLDPVTYEVYDLETNLLVYGPVNLDTAATNAVPNPKVLWIKGIDTTGWAVGNYQIIVKGFDTPMWKSEPQLVRDASDCEDTVLLEATHSVNTQGLVFDSNVTFKVSIRLKGGFDNQFKQKYAAKFYIDQPQDIKVLNGIPYEVGKLFITPIPDYMMMKIMRALMMDGAMLDGEGFSLSEGAEPEEVFAKGAPMKIYSLDIRPSTANQSLNVALGAIDTDNSLIVSVNPQSFGPNITNSSGTTSVALIDITVTP